MAQYPLDSNSYQMLERIGVGVSAIVYKAICMPMNSTVVAIKCINLDQTRVNFERIRHEAKTMTLFSNPNILKAHCCFTVGRHLWVVMPFMSAGSLQSIMSSCFLNGLPEPCIATVLKETLHALSYLHDQGHIHRDIKAGNILIDANGSVKLADFGVSASIYESNYLSGGGASSSHARSMSSLSLTEVAGTPYWMAPEVIHSHNGYGNKADIWSFGITALELAHGRPPLSHLPPSKSLLMKITKKFRFSDYEIKGGSKEKKFSKGFKDMVAQCLHHEPSKRPTAEKLLKHSFFKNGRNSDCLVKSVLHGLPSVEERFKRSEFTRLPSIRYSIENDYSDDEDTGEMESKQWRISDWNFNEYGRELEPVFPGERKEDYDPMSSQDSLNRDMTGISSPGEVITGDNIDSPDGEGDNSNEVASVVTSPGVDAAREQIQVTEEIKEAGGINIENLVSGLIELRNSLDEQRRHVNELITWLQGGAEINVDDQLDGRVDVMI
ncbi:hypothetical protein Droror1_Dr00000888 [Drosera rotundifolia]